MKKATRMLLGIGGLVVLTILAGCNVNGSDGSSPVSVSGAMRRGSIVVGDIRFDEAGVTVTSDEVETSYNYLQDGMMIKLLGNVEGNGTSGDATSVEVENALHGPLADLDVNASTFTVFGVTVVMTYSTVRDFIGTLENNDTVEVHGFYNGAGTIRATRVEEYAPSDTYLEIRGVVTEKSGTTSGTVRIGGSDPINYDDQTEFPHGISFDVGTLIEAELENAGTAFRATRIELESVEDAAFRIDDDIEIEGYVDGFTAHPGTFSVGEIMVQTNGSTDFYGGRAESLGNGVLVEVEGRYIGDVLVVDDLHFEDNIEIVAPADTNGRADVLGFTVNVSALTDWWEEGTLGSEDQITAGQSILIYGFLNGDGSIEAVAISPEESGTVSIQGPVGAGFSGQSLTVAGVTIDISGDVRFEDDDDRILSRDAFVDALFSGATVYVEGSFDVATGVLTASEAELD